MKIYTLKSFRISLSVAIKIVTCPGHKRKSGSWTKTVVPVLAGR